WWVASHMNRYRPSGVAESRSHLRLARLKNGFSDAAIISFDRKYTAAQLEVGMTGTGEIFARRNVQRREIWSAKCNHQRRRYRRIQVKIQLSIGLDASYMAAALPVRKCYPVAPARIDRCTIRKSQFRGKFSKYAFVRKGANLRVIIIGVDFSLKRLGPIHSFAIWTERQAVRNVDVHRCQNFGAIVPIEGA